MCGFGFFLLLIAQEHYHRFDFFRGEFVVERAHGGVRNAVGNIAGDGVIGFAVFEFAADEARRASALAAGAVAKATAFFAEATLTEFDRGFIIGRCRR